jgi:hypothetical protein
MPQDFTTGQVLTAAQMDTLSAAVDGYATTATAAGTTTLTTASMYQQFFTGSTTQTVVMPVASTLYLGQKFRIVNNSSGVVTAQSSGANTIYAIPAGGDVIFTCILASGTTAASWNYKNYISAGGGGGKVLQVVQGTTSTQVINSTSTFADTTLTASITPSAATSKVLILIVQQNVAHAANDASASIPIRLLRGATDLGTFAPQMFYQNAAQWFIGQCAINYLDSPSTTSATTYKTQFNVQFGTAEDGYVQKGNSGISTIILMEIGA